MKQTIFEKRGNIGMIEPIAQTIDRLKAQILLRALSLQSGGVIVVENKFVEMASELQKKGDDMSITVQFV